MDEDEVGGLRIAFERAGHGPPLLLLHGVLGGLPSLHVQQTPATPQGQRAP